MDLFVGQRKAYGDTLLDRKWRSESSIWLYGFFQIKFISLHNNKSYPDHSDPRHLRPKKYQMKIRNRPIKST